MKWELNKWQFGIQIKKCPPWRIGFYPYICLWCLKFTSFPPEGFMFGKENYKGIYWRWEPMKNAVITMRTFQLPLRLRIFLALFGIKTFDVYRLPVWISFIK